jgi:DNA-binding IclR family transcriptional regulator
VLSEEQWRALPGEHPREEAESARARGYATSHDEVIAGLASIAVPVLAHGQPPAALAVVYVSTALDAPTIAARLRAAAAAIQSDLR